MDNHTQNPRIEPSSFANNLGNRMMTALFMGVPALACIYMSHWGLLAICIFASIIGMREFFNMYNIKPTRLEFIVAWGFLPIIWGVPIYVYGLGGLERHGLTPFMLYLLAMPYLTISLLFFKKHERSYKVLIYILFNLVYIQLPFILYYLMSFEDISHPFYNPRLPLWIILLHWFSDSAAYFAGKFLGKHKLWERISPKKTWEGFIGGGVAIGLWAAFVLQPYAPIPNFNWIFVSVVVIVIGTLGDLIESQLKRTQSVKDSGTSLPGHGGVLDRFDSFLITMPILYIYQQWMLL